jgi:hypothetical protein
VREFFSSLLEHTQFTDSAASGFEEDRLVLTLLESFWKATIHFDEEGGR